MDAIDFFLLRYADVHRVLVGGLMDELTEAQIRECAAILDETFQRIREVLRDKR